MRILFVQDNGINESLGLTELGGYLKARGHTVCLLIEKEEADLPAAARDFAPRLAVVPCNVYAHSWTIRTVRALRRVLGGTPILVGGTHPTFAPSFIEHDDIDLQLVGEAELAVAELAERISRGEDFLDIPGVWVKRNSRVVPNGVARRLDDLDSLPIPDRDLYFRYPFMRDFPWKKFTTGRGCPNSCAFCYNHFIKKLYGDGHFVRRKTPGRVVQEVRAVQAATILQWVHFADDLFVTDPHWLKEFAALYPASLSLPFSCNSSADSMNDRVAHSLATAGCRVVAMGVETADEGRRLKLLNKPATNEVIERAARAVRAHGMKLVVFAMVGLPGESLEDAVETLHYCRSLGAEAARVLMAVPLPGTLLTLEAAAAGHLDPRLAEDFTADIDFNSNPYGPYYELPESAPFEHLVNLAPLVWRLPPGPALRMLRSLPRTWSRPGRIWMSLQEKAIYRFTMLDGIRFFAHVGNPMNRTTNYVTLI